MALSQMKANDQTVLADTSQVLAVHPIASSMPALIGLSLAILSSSLAISITNVALPSLLQIFSTSMQNAQWVTLAYLLTLTSLIVVAGRIGDILGRRKILLLGIALFTLSALICAFADHFILLIIARAIQGLSGAILMTLSLGMVGDILPKNKAGRAMGLMGTASAIGTASGPALGGFLLSFFDWRAVFLVQILPAIAAFLLIWDYDCNPSRMGEKKLIIRALDIKGTFLLTITLTSYVLALSLNGREWGAANIIFIILSLISLIFFLWVERYSPSPLIDLTGFYDVKISAGLAANLLVSAIIMTSLVVGPFYLSEALSLDPIYVGLVLSTGPIVSAITGIPAGYLTDRFGSTIVASVGLIGIIAGCLTLALLPTHFGIPGYVGPLMILTSGYALFQAANNTALMKDLPSEKRGVSAGMLTLSRNLGLITGIAAMGAIFAHISETSALISTDAERLARGMQITFGTAAFLGLIGLIMFTFSYIWRRRSRA